MHLRITLRYVAILALFGAQLCAQSSERVLHAFSSGADGIQPWAKLISDSGGNLYGTTWSGGIHNHGTVFELSPSPDGRWLEHILYAFDGAHGGQPFAGVVQDAAGKFYGTTYEGGADNCGVVYQLSQNLSGGWDESVLYAFTCGEDGANPKGGVVSDTNGNLYGTTTTGGLHGFGVVFQISRTSETQWTQTVLFQFTGGADGGRPFSGVVLDPSGSLFGTTELGGSCAYVSGGCGTIFRLTPNAGEWSEKVLYNFCEGDDSCSDGYFPTSDLTFDSKGNLYGTTTTAFDSGGVLYSLSKNSGFKILAKFQSRTGIYPSTPIVDQAGNIYCTTADGGAYYGGTIFELPLHAKQGTVLFNFFRNKGGTSPQSALLEDSSGNFYGTAFSGGTGNAGTVFKFTPNSSSYKVIHDFTSGNDGHELDGPLTADVAGNLYGTTFIGGDNNKGTVFRLSRGSANNWDETLLYTFTGGSDGGTPYSGLTLDAAGNLYGTTYSGGSRTHCVGGCGVIFELSRNPGDTWTYRVLYTFGGKEDGSSPTGQLIFDGKGALFGTANLGGNYYGTVFKLTPGDSGHWMETTLYAFPNGGQPHGSLVIDEAGNIYGTAEGGGAENQGLVFELTPTSRGGWTEKNIYEFTGGADGGFPSGLVADAVGNLYGTTAYGGVGYGGVFELTKNTAGMWAEHVLYSFSGNGDGASPYGGVIFGQSSTLYGTTWSGGLDNRGSIFSLSPTSGNDWSESILHSFTGGSDGGSPYAGLLLGSDGGFFGVADGGASNEGVVFELRK